MQQAIADGGKKEQIVFISFCWQTVLDIKKAFPNNKCCWLSAARIGLKKRMQQASGLGLDGVDLEAERLIELGVSGITTNRPAWLKEQLVR